MLEYLCPTQIAPVVLAMAWPAMSAVDPRIGSNIDGHVRGGLPLPPSAMLRSPTDAAQNVAEGTEQTRTTR